MGVGRRRRRSVAVVWTEAVTHPWPPRYEADPHGLRESASYLVGYGPTPGAAA